MSEREQEESPELPQDTLAALRDFYAEKDAQHQRFEKLQHAAEQQFALSMDMFSEDWNSSQFWYTDATALALARELLKGAGDDTRIAVVSAPSVFVQLKNLLMEGSEYGSISPSLTLLEFDRRFAVLKEFVFYDYNAPLSLPAELKGGFDRIICDPPFLSDECQTKAALTVRWMSRKGEEAVQKQKLIACTGERMQHLIPKIYMGVRTTTFEPQHAQSRLSNEFRCYANFECDSWTWM